MPTYIEIQKQIEQLRAQAEQVRLSELASVISEVKAKIKQFGLTAKDLGLATGKSGGPVARSSAKSTPMFQNASGQTWSGGRGRKPDWVKAILNTGGSMEEFRIKG
jgi:DNA-binding protein H-NS